MVEQLPLANSAAARVASQAEDRGVHERAFGWARCTACEVNIIADFNFHGTSPPFAFFPRAACCSSLLLPIIHQP